MSTAEFPFTVTRPYSERYAYQTFTRALTGVFVARRNEMGGDQLFRARFNLRLPRDSQTLTTWYDFWDAREGSYDSFLYKANLTQHYEITAEAVGTGDASTTDFALDKKHIDASTLVVKLDGTPTVLYTLTGNNTAPIVELNSAPGGGVAITADYEYFHQVHFESDDLEPEILSRGATDATTKAVLRGVEVVETQPGDHDA